MPTRTHTEDRERSRAKQADFSFRLLILAGACFIAAVMGLITYGPHLTGFIVILAYIAATVGFLLAAIGWYPDRAIGAETDRALRR